VRIMKPLSTTPTYLGGQGKLKQCMATVQLTTADTAHMMSSGIPVEGVWTSLQNGTVESSTARPLSSSTAVTGNDGRAMFVSQPFSSAPGYGCMFRVLHVPGFEIDPASDWVRSTSWPDQLLVLPITVNVEAPMASGAVQCTAAVALTSSFTSHRVGAGVAVQASWGTLQGNHLSNLSSVGAHMSPTTQTTDSQGQAIFWSHTVECDNRTRYGGCGISVEQVIGYQLAPHSYRAGYHSWAWPRPCPPRPELTRPTTLHVDAFGPSGIGHQHADLLPAP
jgi:hypothetical protein